MLALILAAPFRALHNASSHLRPRYIFDRKGLDFDSAECPFSSTR